MSARHPPRVAGHLAQRRAEAMEQADRGAFWRDMIGLTSIPAYDLDTFGIHWIDGADSDTAFGPEYTASDTVVPRVTAPLEVLQHGLCFFSTYSHPAAEDEYRRFRDHTRSVLQLGWWLLIANTVFMLASFPLASDIDAHIRGTMTVVSTLAIFTVAVCVSTRFARSFAAACADAFAQHTPSSDGGDEALKARLRSLRREHAQSNRVIVTASMILVIAGLYAGNVGTECDDTPYDASETTADAVCHESLTYLHAVPIWIVVIFLRIPSDSAACGAFSSALWLFDLALQDSAVGWVFVEVGAIGVLAGFAVALAVARDVADRRHFGSLVDAHIAWHTLEKKHETLAVVVGAMVPRALAARVSAPLRWVGMPSEDALEGNAPGAASLPSIHESSNRATIAVTEAVDFAAFERACSSFRQPLTGLAHLITLFDIGTNLFQVDRGVVFGDAYVVTAGLVHGSAATALQLARFCLWQLQLDEAAMLPLRASIATGHATGGIVGTSGALRYQVGGEALGRALQALPATDATTVTACSATRALVNWQLAVESRGSVPPGGGGDAAGCPPDDASGLCDVITPVDVAAHAAEPRRDIRSEPSEFAEGAWSESSGRSPAGSTLVALHLLPDAAAAHEDAPSRRAPLERSTASLTRVAIRSHSSRIHEQPAGGGGVIVAAALTPTTAQHPSSPPPTPAAASDEGGPDDVPSSPRASGLEVSNGRFASPRAEAAYRDVPQTRAMPFMLSSVAVCIVFFALSDWLDTSVNPADAFRDANAAASAYMRLLLPVVDLSLVGGLMIAGLCQPTSGGDALHRGIHLVSYATCAIPAAWLWLTPGSFLRHRPIAFLTILVPCLAIHTLRGQRWYVMTVAAWATIVHPVFSHGISSAVAEEAFVALLGTAAFAHMWATSSRRRFAARFVANARLEALEKVTQQLSGLCAGLMPPHVVEDGIDDAFAAAVRMRIANAPDEQSTAIVQSAVDAGPDDEAAMATALAALGKVLGGDYGAEPADHFEWIAVGELHFIPVPPNTVQCEPPLTPSTTTASTTTTSPLDDLWGAIAECLDAANAGALQPSQEILDAFDELELNRANPLLRSPSAGDDDRAGGSSSMRDALLVGDLRGYRASSSHIRILRALHDTLVVGGPLYERAHREAAALSAANVVRFVDALAPRARAAGFEICAAFVAEEAAGGLVGRGTMRYTVTGSALRQVRALARSLRMSFDAPGRSLVAPQQQQHRGVALLNRHFADQLRVAALLSAQHLHPLGFDPAAWVGAEEIEAPIAEPSIGLTRPRRVLL